LVGGLVLQHFEWGAVFLIGVPVMGLLLVLGPVLLPESKTDPGCGIDLISALLSLSATLLVVYGLKGIAAYGWQSVPVICIAAGSVVLIAFVRRQGGLAHPLIDLRLFRVAGFTLALLAYTLGCLVASGMYLFIAQYLQLVLELRPLEAGLWTLPATVGLAIGSMLTPVVVRRLRSMPTMSAGFAITTVGLAVIPFAERTSSIGLLAVALFMLYLGLAPVFISAMDLMVSAVPLARAGEVSAISETGSELGSALGVAILGSIGMAVYRAAVKNAIPDGISPPAARAARDTLGGAFAVAQQLPHDLSQSLLKASRAAFDSGFRVTTALSAAVIVAVALVIVIQTRARDPAIVEEEEPVRLDDMGQ
jgi:DHA2 family multidrug resistance protein-like MFS transporter